MSTTHPARVRRTFSRLGTVLDVPNLIDIQKASFEWFLNEGLRETISDISPIEDFTGTLAVQFERYTLGGWQPGMPMDQIVPNNPIKECREKDMVYAAPLTMEVSFVNRETGEIREQKVFMGDLPLMTDWGTFIVNGTERVVVTQLVRSPGAYVMEPKDREKQVLIANLMPSRGSWVELEIDKKGLVHVRIDRKRKLPVTTLLYALGYTRDDIENLFRHPEDDSRVNPFIAATLEKDGIEGQAATGNRSSLDEVAEVVTEMQALHAAYEQASTDERARIDADVDKLERRLDLRAGETMQQALIEVFKKQRPGEPPTVDNSRSLVRSLFFDPKRYDLTKVGRYKLDARLGLDVGSSVRTLTNPRFTGRRSGMNDDLVELVRRLVGLPIRMGLPEDSKDFAADAATLPARRDRRRSRRVRALRQPATPHRRRADPGGVPDRPLPDGARRPRADEHRGRRHDHAADHHQHPAGGGGAQGVLRLLAALAVHGPDQLAGRPHAPPPPLGARRGRPDA